MRRGTFVRWGVPVAAAAVIAAAVGAGPVIAAVSGAPALPERSAQQLLAAALAAAEKSPPPMSGTVQQTASLGLPALPAAGAGSPVALLSGSHEVKVWYGANGKFRIAMPTQMNETNLIVNGGQAWYWDSAANTATKLAWQSGARRSPAPAASTPAATPADLTPQAAAEKVLEQAGEHSAVRVINTAEVAGRPVYQLVLAPKDDGSLVQEVRLALDGETYVPLQVQVYAKGAAEPAFQVGFTQVTFTPPAEENFTFTPPAGAKVAERSLGADGEAGKEAHPGDADKAARGLKFVGDGWTRVAVVKASAADLAGGTQPDAGQGERRGEQRGERPGRGGDEADGQAVVADLLKKATPVSGPWGSGRLISTKLVTALLTDDGRLLVGAVTPEEITEAAGVR